MPTVDALSDTSIRKAKPKEKAYKLADGLGLYAEVRPSGRIWWRFRYRFGGKQLLLSMGTYPEVSLKLARDLRDEARRLVAAGQDPSEARKADKGAQLKAREAQALAAAGLPVPGTFEHLARTWHTTKKGEWSDSHAVKVLRRLELDVFPYLGKLQAGEIRPPLLLETLRRIEARGALETAQRVRDACSQVFRFGVATGACESDPARDLAGAIKRAQVRHLAAVTDPQAFGQLLRAIEAYRGTPIVRACLRLAPLVFVRPGAELRGARWDELDLDAGTWTIPADRMKRTKDGKRNGSPHLVPLSRQAVAILRDLHPLTGHGPLVFRGERDHERPISENTLNHALDALGYDSEQMRAHGFRAAARTLLHERLGIAPEVIEAQLAHRVPDALGRAYNRTEFADQRRQMMQVWADYCDRLRSTTEAPAAAAPATAEAA